MMPTWICNICGKKVTGGCNDIVLDMGAHSHSEHPKEMSDALADRWAYEKELSEFETSLRKKYPAWNASTHVALFTKQPMKERKLWKCPACGQKLSYHLKRHHQMNPITMCIPHRNVSESLKEKEKVI